MCQPVVGLALSKLSADYLVKVMSELYQPKKKFAKSVSAAMITIVVLFMLVNISYASLFIAED